MAEHHARNDAYISYTVVRFCFESKLILPAMKTFALFTALFLTSVSVSGTVGGIARAGCVRYFPILLASNQSY
jgi:hypothetical protein